MEEEDNREMGIEIGNLRRERMGGMGRTDVREGRENRRREREIAKKNNFS